MGTEQKYQEVDVNTLLSHPRNPRIGNVDAIKASIKRNGFYGAVYVQKSTNYVLAGNHRLKAAIELGMVTIPVVWLDVTDDTALSILLADNRTSDLGHYDTKILDDILSDLRSVEGGLLGTGYDPATLDWDVSRELYKLRLATAKTEAPLKRYFVFISAPLEAQTEIEKALKSLLGKPTILVKTASN